jgi:hypothetical protein
MRGVSLSSAMRASSWWLVPVLASVAMFTVVTLGRVDLRTDSIYYLSCAETLLHRHELGAGVYFSERIARASNGERIEDLRRWPRQPAEPGEAEGRPPEVAPYTAWPPGFSVFLAAFLGAFPSRAGATFGAMLTSYALLALGAALLGRALGSASFALISGLAVVASPYLFDAGTCFLGSDVLCTALVLMALAALVSWTQRPSVHALVAAVACAIAAAYVRYLAPLLVPVIVGYVATAVWRGQLVGRAARVQLAIAVVPAPLAMGPLLLRNLRETGFLFGTERLPSDRALLGNVEDVARSTLRALPLSFDAIPGKLDLAVSAAITVLFVVLAVIYARSDRATLPERAERRAILPLLVFGAVYVTALVAVRTRTLADELEARLLLPALVSLTMAGMLVGAKMIREGARVRVGVALVALLGAATLSEVPAQQARVQARAERAEARAGELRSLLGDGTTQGVPALLFSDRAFEVSAAIGGTVHWLPAPSRVPSIEEHTQGRPMAFVLQRGSPFFPCAAMESAYERWLARSARLTKRGETFEVYWLTSGSADPPSAVEDACDGYAAAE